MLVENLLYQLIKYMGKCSKKYKVSITSNIKVLYCENRNLVTVLGPVTKESIKINLKLKIVDKNKTIFITNILTNPNLRNTEKTIKALQGTTTALIKQLLMTTSTTMYKKLNFVGIGYKAFDVDNFKNQLLLMKLGFSHSIYFKIPTNLNICSIKQNKLFIYGFSNQVVAQTAALIQSFKLPEPYKGKGILYANTKIKLKEGKKHK